MVVPDVAAGVSYQPDLSSITAVEFGSKDDAGPAPVEMLQSKEMAVKDASSSQSKQSSSARSTVHILHLGQPDAQESQEKLPSNAD
jgi:hypothetical protein